MKIHPISQDNQDLLNRCYQYAKKDLYENLVLIGDLFPPCLDLSDIFGVFEGNNLLSFFTVFKGFQVPSVVILNTSDAIMEFILSRLRSILPRQFVLVSSTIDATLLRQNFSLNDQSAEFCMVTNRTCALFHEADISFTHASTADLTHINAFYKKNNTFPWNPIQLESQFYFFKKKKGFIIACGGTHFETPELAHLGNILVLPEFRGQSIGKNLVSTIGKEILKKKEIVSLFVAEDNFPAIRLYQKVGFSHKRNYSIFSCSSD